MIRVTLEGGSSFTGKSADTIIRREFGRRAWIKWGRTETGVEFGDVLVPSEYADHAHHHVGRVLYVEHQEHRGKDEN